MKCMVVFAGPNGSGKSTLVNKYIKKRDKRIDVERHINPDDINLLNILDFNKFGLIIDENDFRNFITTSIFFKDCNLEIKDICINNNSLIITKRSSYLSAILAEYLRHCYISSNEPLFSYETVFSHPSRVSFLEKAKNCGWQVFLHFICTEDPDINYDRVKERVLKGEHDVPHDKIEERYKRSLDLLFPALQYCHQVYFFDNSEQDARLVAKKNSDDTYTIFKGAIPWWFIEHVLSKIN
jgi:predicted ABC-type ATPase